ncbi:MAG: acyl-CoA reductase [Bacteroidota bacterium]
MNLHTRISAFSSLGETLRDALVGKQTGFTDRISHLIETQYLKNPWFTPDNVRMAIGAIAGELTQENLTRWCSAYPALDIAIKPLNAGVVMAGNIPLAGFHDLLCVLISGNRLIARTSSKDNELVVLISDVLRKTEPGFSSMITITEGTISDFNVIIATGSDNSSRYFEYYFGKYPHIIRKNRNSVAVLDGTEIRAELENLGTDIFSYFGLGCRNVSKLYIPAGYDLKSLISCWDQFTGIIKQNKYANNYDFHKAVLMVNKDRFLDTGYLLMKEHPGLSSPVAVLYYEAYSSRDSFIRITKQNSNKIQCIIGREYVPFGKAQMPALWDYADGVDTIAFLLKKNSPGIL